ncbi:hypothetical protein B5807_10592 [Epicoccum nigrum]|uniref:Uncharacterized protein n=1 Tax=Epicoccum nigrum TaxID=105696 RepID=A0A1Y2LMR8_EPING|nr:hypothetical protein B5807_10592 [Epicoccum nigrum]
MTVLTNHLVADAARLSMAQLIPRIAIFLIALGLNRILPSPIAITIVTAFTILVVKWQTVGHMSDRGAVVDSALYFSYLIATIVGEWMQKKKLVREIRRLTQKNDELTREKGAASAHNAPREASSANYRAHSHRSHSRSRRMCIGDLVKPPPSAAHQEPFTKKR